ncbi:MAG: dienelactone hydrolase family protein [Alphaproteobacteria bacterium]
MPDITIKAADGGTFSAYLAEPKAGKGAGVLVIQEIFGVNKVMRQISDDLAAQGYFALCPDIFWRQEPGVQLTDQTDAEWARAFEFFKGFDEANGISDLKASLAHLRGVKGCTGKAGTVGYCLGGRLVYLMAARSDADCNVSFYGVGIENNLDEVKSIKKPTILHIAEKDSYVPPAAQAKIKSALQGHPHVTIHSYAGQEHAFARTGGKHYDKASAGLANKRSTEFFRKHLA